MSKLEYSQSIKGNFFRLVHNICELELDVTMERQKKVQWIADSSIFAGYLALNPAFLKFTPNKRSFIVDKFQLVLDDGDMSLGMTRRENYEEGSLERDPFVIDVLEQASQIFESHEHADCLDKARQRESSRMHGHQPLPTLRALNGEVLVP